MYNSFCRNGEVPEWLKGADCKSAAFRFVGSNPTLTTTDYRGVEQLVARRAHNPKVVGSNPSPATKFQGAVHYELPLIFFSKRKRHAVYFARP